MKVQQMQNVSDKGWSEAEINAWRDGVIRLGKVRDYAVILQSLQDACKHSSFSLTEYGRDKSGNAFFYASSPIPSPDKANFLITAGVHGYEPSGVLAAIEFIRDHATAYVDRFNLVVFPCISPWAFEYDQRWSTDALDTNRMFFDTGSRVIECTAFMTALRSLEMRFVGAIDLHETRDIDIHLNEIRDRRFGITMPADQTYASVPNGYYVIVSKTHPNPEDDPQFRYGCAVVKSVKQASPLASDPVLLGHAENRGGVASMAPTPGTMRTFLAGHSDHVAVTEAYPDHPEMTPRLTVVAQLKALEGALQFVADLQVARTRHHS